MSEWRPEMPVPERPTAVPADASWDPARGQWTHGALRPDGKRDGKWRSWAMNGTQCTERLYVDGVDRSISSFHPSGKIAAKVEHDAAAKVTTHEAFYPDGRPWSVVRYTGEFRMRVKDDEILFEELHSRDGKLMRQVTNERDDDGLVATRRRGPGGVMQFENVRTPEGRALRFFEKGEPTATVRASDEGALVLVDHRAGDKEYPFEGLDIDESTGPEIEGALGGPLFAATIESMDRPDIVKAFVAKNPWADKVVKEAPFAHASIANFLTALGSTVPNVSDLGVVGLRNLVDEETTPAVIEVLDAMGSERAKLAKSFIAPDDDEQDEDEDEDESEDEAKEEKAPAEGEVEIGRVTLPSGNLVLVDMGAMGQWKHEGEHQADLSGSKWAEHVNAKKGDFVDLRIVGDDANAALAAFIAEHGGRSLFDVNRAWLDDLSEKLAKITKANGLRASLEVAPHRLGHGERLRLLKTAGLPHASFGFAHVNVIGIFDLPRDREMRVVGKYDDDGAWEYVSLVCKDTEMVTSEKVDGLSVEEARFMFADAEAVRAWDHERSIDALYDLVFWGGNEAALAEATCAELAYENTDYLGWADVPPGGLPPQIVERVFSMAEGRRGITAELRPHSSHNAILRGAWTSPHEAGTATIGGAKICGLFTKVGDGVFDVVLERDAAGDICRVTVEITRGESEDAEDEDD